MYLPMVNSIEAYITPTPFGETICFSRGLDDLMSAIFQTLVKATPFTSATLERPQISSDEASHRVLNIVDYILSDYRGERPGVLGLEGVHYQLSDYINNHFQQFVLSHEYNHFLLGHLEDEEIGLNAEGNASEMPSLANDLYQEFEADKLAVTMMINTNDDDNALRENILLLTSLYVYLIVVAIVKVRVGFQGKALETSTQRIDNLNHVFQEYGVKPTLLKEADIVKHSFEISMGSRGMAH